MVDMTRIIVAVIELTVGILIGFAIPFFLAKTPEGQRKKALFLVAVAVKAAEQIFKGTGRGEEKKAWVLEKLSKWNITLDLDILDAMVESAVYEIKNAIGVPGIGAASEFVPRLTCPEAGNPYYNTPAKGGYSGAIQGNPTHAGCNVLSNCVGYAYGRFNEIGGWGSCKYLRPVNAENFIQYAGGLQVGKEPRVGGCMVWQKGSTLSNADGAGHVAIVEKVNADGSVLTSESGWGTAVPFWTKTRTKGADGNWGAGSGYTYLGCIYNPAPCCDSSPDKSQDTPVETVSYSVTVTASGLNVRTGAGTSYGVCGGLSRGQNVQVCQESGNWGKLKTGGWICLDYVKKAGAVADPVEEEVELTGVVTASGLNVRRGPGTNNAIIGALHNGDSCLIVKQSGNWGQLAEGGWVCLDYVKKK